MTDRFCWIGNRVYDIGRALQIADDRAEVDVLAWAGNNRVASANLDFKRAMASDLTQPILIAHGKVIDGSDRLYKALKTGQKKMHAYILSNEQALSVMTIKTAVKRVHPDIAKEIRQKHKQKGDLAHPFYALEKRKPGEKDRTCRECNKTIEGDAIYFDRATGDEPWLRQKGYICLKHENDADVEKWIRCPKRECKESVPESDWSAHWRDHTVAASVHRYHFAKIAHCGQCEEDREIEAPKKRIDGEEVDIEKTAGDVIPVEVFQRKRDKLDARYPQPATVQRILTETDDEFMERIRKERERSEFSRQFDLPLDGDEWPPNGPKAASTTNLPVGDIGLTKPQFPEWKPRVDETNQALTDPTKNPSIQREVDELGTDLARFTGQPRPFDPTIRRAGRRSSHYHTVTDVTGEHYRTVPCGEHLMLNFRLAGSNKRDLREMQGLIDEWHDNTTVEHELPDGFHIRRLNTIGDHVVEGSMMRHCLNESTRAMMGEEVRNPMTGERIRLPGTPVIPRDPDMQWGSYELPRIFREQGKPFFSEREQVMRGQVIPGFRFQGPLFSLRSRDNLPKATFFHPINHDTGEMNRLVAHDIYGVNNRDLHPKYRYRMYQYMLDNLNADATGADSVTLRWGKHYEGEQALDTPEDDVTDTEVLTRAELEAKVAELDRQYVRNETDKNRPQDPDLKTAHRHGMHAHTYVNESGTNFKTVPCSFGRVVSPIMSNEFSNWRSASTAREIENRDELLALFGDNTTLMHTFDDDYQIRRLNTLGDYRFEGNLNRNCLRQYAQHAVESRVVPDDNSIPFEISSFPYIMGEQETQDPYEMEVLGRPWRYTGPFYSLRDHNGISKATFFHPLDRTTGEPNPRVVLDAYGINNSELHDRYKRRIYQYLLHNLKAYPGDGFVTVRWGLTNPYANIDTPEDEMTKNEVLDQKELQARVLELSGKYIAMQPPKMSRVNNFWGWKNGRLSKKKGDCQCWEGYERVPGTEPCAPGSCRKRKGPVKKSTLSDSAREIMERGKRDQEVRIRLEQSGYDESVAKEMKDIDSDNLQWLKNYVKENGFPGKSKVGEEGAAGLWAMTQHAGPDDLDFMKEVHGLMSASPDDHDPALRATLEDRINVYEGKPQTYGTQSFSEDGGKTWKMRDVADPEGLAERRKRVGLEDYDKEEKQAAKKSDSPFGLIFQGEDKVIVGAQHQTPIELSDELTKKVQAIGEKHGYWYEGIGGDIEPNKDKFGTKKNYKGSWDDEFVNSLKDDSSDYFLIFPNVTVNNTIGRVTDPDNTIFDSILNGYKEGKEHKFLYYKPDVKPTADMLTEHLKNISDDDNDFLEMSKQKATKENTTKFLRTGEKLMWPKDGDPKARGTTNASKVETRLNNKRDNYLLSQEKGVFVTGAGHLPNLLALDDSLEMLGGEKAK